MGQVFLNFLDLAQRKRCGAILAELLVGSCLALTAGAIVLESTSMLVKSSTVAKVHHDAAYALMALVEEASLSEKGGLLQGNAGWQAEIEPGSFGAHISSRIVRITGRQGSGPVSLEWETWGVPEW